MKNLIQSQKEYIEFLDKYVTTHHITCDEDEFQKGIILRQSIKDAEADLNTTPALTPEKLGEMFDAKAIAWDEVSPGSKVMESQEFIEIAQELTSQTRQPETEINLPSDEAVREWFKGDLSGRWFWKTGSWNNEQVANEILTALKYFIVDNPVKTEKNKSNIDYETALDEYLKDGINYNANTIKKANKCDLEQLAADSFFYGYRFAVDQKQSEIPEDRLREPINRNPDKYFEVGNAVTDGQWNYRLTYVDNNGWWCQGYIIGSLLHTDSSHVYSLNYENIDLINERKEKQ